MLYPRTDRQQQFIDVARSLLPVLRARAAQHDRDGTFPHENFVDIRRVGLPALVVPQEFGGWGANLLESTLTMETLAQGDGSTALSFVMHVQVVGGVAEIVAGAAADEERSSWPPSLFAQICRDAVEQGALINSVATEPNLGSPSRGGLPETTAAPVRENGKTVWLVNGLKTFASLSPEMDYFIIPAALQDGSGHVARFVIPAGPPL